MHLGQAEEKDLSIYHAPFPEHLRLVIVVNLEAFKQNVVLLGCQGPLTWFQIPRSMISLTKIILLFTLSSSSAWARLAPPCSTSAQKVVLYRLLMWPAHASTFAIRHWGRSSGTVNLSPAHVVPQILTSRVLYHPTIEWRHRRRECLVRKVGRPEIDIIWSKGRHNGGENFADQVDQTHVALAFWDRMRVTNSSRRSNSLHDRSNTKLSWLP